MYGTFNLCLNLHTRHRIQGFLIRRPGIVNYVPEVLNNRHDTFNYSCDHCYENKIRWSLVDNIARSEFYDRIKNLNARHLRIQKGGARPGLSEHLSSTGCRINLSKIAGTIFQI